MKLSENLIEIIACGILIFVSLAGNTTLIYCTWRCIARRLPTSFALIFSLSVVHLIKNLVVNTINIIFSSGFPSNSLACKIGTFTGKVTTTLEIWFTLYLAAFYCVKLNRIIYKPRAPPNAKWRKPHLISVLPLWIIAAGLCCPYLIFGEVTEHAPPLNYSRNLHYSFPHEECSIEFRDDVVNLCYQQIFIVIIDLLPLVILVLVCFRIVLLFFERKKTTYGNIWIGNYASEREVLRASKIIIVLMFIITFLWVFHFIVEHFFKNCANTYPFTPTILVVLFSGYSSLSPYLLMLINYKICLKLRSMSSFCCTIPKKNKPPGGQKSLPENIIIENREI